MAVLAVATALTVLALEIELVLVEARSTVLPHDVRGAVTLAGAPVASQGQYLAPKGDQVLPPKHTTKPGAGHVLAYRRDGCSLYLSPAHCDGRSAARAREEAMPFDGIADPVAAKSLQALDLMEDRLQGGRKWARHFMFRDGGKMCLLGASYFGCEIDAGSKAGRALEYLVRAIRPVSRAKDWSDRCWVETTITDFNDSCAGYGEIERVLRAAQELARTDIAAAQLA